MLALSKLSGRVFKFLLAFFVVVQQQKLANRLVDEVAVLFEQVRVDLSSFLVQL